MPRFDVGGGTGQRLRLLLLGGVNHAITRKVGNIHRQGRLIICGRVHQQITGLNGLITGCVGHGHGERIITVRQNGQIAGRDLQRPAAIAADAGKVKFIVQGDGNVITVLSAA